MMTLLLITGLYQLWSISPSGTEVLEMSLWTVGGALVVMVGTYLVLQFERTIGASVIQPINTAIGAGFSGMLLGFVAGWYQLKQSRKSAKLDQRRDVAESMIGDLNTRAKRLAVLNRILRHDVRNHMNIISGHMAMAERGEVDFEEAAENIQQSVKRITQLSADARQFEELIESNHPKQEYIDVLELVRELQDEYDSNEAGVSISVELPEAAVVEASPLLNSAFRNIIENAIEHTDAETVTIAIEVTVSCDSVAITLVDDGPGIPQDVLETFNNGEESSLDHLEGLGLWIIEWIVEESGGDIGFQSESDGTVVTITLPRADH
jgi:signal transduction histidine kinase